jgi:hypothetical protein
VLEGDSIAVHFREGEIFRTDVVGDAHSIYVPQDLGDEVAFNEVAATRSSCASRRSGCARSRCAAAWSGTYHFARLDRMGAGRARGLAGDRPCRTPPPGREPTAGHGRSPVALPDTLDRAGVPRTPCAAATSTTLDFTGTPSGSTTPATAVLRLAGRTIAVSRDARLVYGTMTLRRATWSWTPRTGSSTPTAIRLEDGEVIVGQQMGYDFGHRTGAVRDGVTTFDGYYYVGDQVNRYPDGSLKICSGRMTSCDHAEPHYHFWGQRMKIRLDDRVVAAPIVLKVGRVPIFALPFYFKSLKEGRRSGILFPNFNFGWSSREGRYIRNFGYYWATNDYTDFTFEIDYNERRELAWRVRNRYVKRYAFNGGIEYNALRGLRAGEELREWQLRWRHDQPKLFDDYRFRGDVEMASRELSRSNLNLDRGRDIISGQLKSNVYLSRSFGFGGGSLNASRTEYTNARDDDPATDKADLQR